jgi:hypothetical protein
MICKRREYIKRCRRLKNAVIIRASWLQADK